MDFHALDALQVIGALQAGLEELGHALHGWQAPAAWMAQGDAYEYAAAFRRAAAAVLGTLVIFTFDPCIDPKSTLDACRMP